MSTHDAAVADELGASERFPLTPAQKALLAESLVALDKGINVEQVVWELDHVPDVVRFRAAWQAAFDTFDALRLGFEWPKSSKEPQQSVRARAQLPFRVLECTESGSREQQARLTRFLEHDRSAGFNLLSQPLTRVSLLILSPSTAVCVWTIHHSIVDGGSYALVLQRVLHSYAGSTQVATKAQGVPPQFRDFLRWLEHYDTAPATEHFMELLRGFDQPTPLPLPASLGLMAQHRTLQTQLRLGPQVAERLRGVAEETSTTPNTLIQLAWAMLLSAHSAESDVLFGATWSGRFGTIEDALQIVGPLINTLPVRVNLNGAGTVRGLLTELRRQHLALRPFQRAALSTIKASSKLAGSAHLFQTLVVFEYERFYTQLQRWDERWRKQRVRSRSQTGYPLVLAAWFEDGELALELEYDAGLYAVESAVSLLADYARLLRGICEHLDASPHAVPMLDPELCATLTTVEAQRELTPELPVAIERIVRQARANPSAVAVKELDGQEVAYAELERRVRRLSGVLRRNGVGPGVLVGVWLPRSIDWVVALLAVHAAGGAFVPLDPQEPQQRIEFVLRDAKVTRLLVSRQTRGRLESGCAIELDVDDPAREEDLDEPTEWVFPDPVSPAYVIYTSGSTGEPKGVCISQGALANHLRAITEQFALVPQDRVLQFMALTFDAALEEVIPTLATGATLVLRNDAIVNSARDFFDSVAAENITVLNLPTAFWHQLVQAQHLKWPSCLRLVVVGGERVSPEAHRRFREADTGHIRWMNTYGPTETTITSTCYDDEEGDHGANGIPIGRPLAGVSHFVLDEHLRLVPPGAAGQLYIGGAGVALGYLYREELTAQRFVAHPFREGARLYATGDRVRRTAAGNYVYIDRLDNQVKVRGFRVELGEIESRLRRHPAVGEAAVVMHKQLAGDASLVGFVTADEGRDVSEELLREHLAAALPAHMVPSRIIISASLPTTPSGKLDRVALAECELAERLDSDAPPSVTDSLLGTLMHIWTNVLGAPVTNTSTSFFDLGGHSLLVVQMFSEIEQRLGRTCSAAAFVKNPTISHLAELLRASTDLDPSGLIQLTQGQPGILPLFLVAGLTGSEMDYVHLVDALSNDVPVYALRLRAFRDSEHPDQTLREAARDLADLMQEAQPRGPYAVAGYSASGTLALVIAEELRARGESTDFVGLIDSAPPNSVPVPSPLTSPRRLVRMLKAGVGRVREHLAGPRALPRIWRRARAAAVRSAARWNVLPIRYELTVDDIFVDMPVKFSDREIKSMQRYLEAIVGHDFDGMPIDLVLFRTPLDPFEGPHEHDLGWRHVTTGRVIVEQVHGTHSSVLTPVGCQELVRRFEPYLMRRVSSRAITDPIGSHAPARLRPRDLYTTLLFSCSSVEPAFSAFCS